MPDSAADLLPLDQYLTWRLHRINKLSDKGSADAYAAQLDLPVGEARCLAAIGSFAPLSIVDLAARANLDKGQASRAAQALVGRGLVSKTTSATDRRGVTLSLTASGQTLWRSVMGLIARRNHDIFSCLSVPEQQQLGDMLDRLIAHSRP